MTGGVRRWLGLGLVLLFYLIGFESLAHYSLTSVFLLLLYFIFGALIGFECVIRDAAKEGKWQIDFARFLGLGISLIPLVAIGMFLFLVIAVDAVSKSYGVHLSSLSGDMGLIELSTILLGYLITSSIRKI